MFVVQRAFSRVRRGYDPDEVDRHLEQPAFELLEFILKMRYDALWH